MDIETIKQLDEWMTDNCYNDGYGIAGRVIHEGYGLEQWGSLYVWFYTERGNRDNLHYFESEQEAVAFAFKTITANKSANRHLVGFLKNKSQEMELLAELNSRNLEYWKDEIPYGGPNDPRFRVFVFGCDIHQALDLKEKYGEIK